MKETITPLVAKFVESIIQFVDDVRAEGFNDGFQRGSYEKETREDVQLVDSYFAENRWVYFGNPQNRVSEQPIVAEATTIAMARTIADGLNELFRLKEENNVRSDP